MAIFQEKAGNLLPECHVSNLNFTGGACDNWSYKKYKAPVKSSPPTNQHHFIGVGLFIGDLLVHQKTPTTVVNLSTAIRVKKRRERTVV